MLAVIIATAGRPGLILPLMHRLGRQSRLPDVVLLVPSRPEDLPARIEADAAAAGCPVTLVTPCKGLTAQRNAGLDWLKAAPGFCSPASAVVFFDDDFLPHCDWLANAARVFEQNPSVVGLTGVVVADGVKGPGLTVDDAERRLATAVPKSRLVPATLYGCNMAVRATAAEDLRFDEALPLYAWQEDYDYSQCLVRLGRVVRSDLLVGVHLGTKSGRVSGTRFGYSQIANPYYLWRKGTMGLPKLARLLGGNISTNLRKAVSPEPYVDRRGRLKGNMIAFRDLTFGRLAPGRIMEIVTGSPIPRQVPTWMDAAAVHPHDKLNAEP